MFAAAPVLALALAAPLASGAPEAAAEWTATLARARENPTGIQFGYWPNFNQAPTITRELGRRPIYRVGFTKWSMVEPEKGRYDWGTQFRGLEEAHKCGATVAANLNVIFSHEINPKGTHGIPEFYPPRITHPETREAAHRLVYAYTQELLRRVGDVILTFDYELVWNYLTSKPPHRAEYRDWFVEACETARRAAADLSMSGRLKLMPIVNGNPLSGAHKQLGGGEAPEHRPQQWLLDVVAPCDFLGVDTYGFDPSDPRSAETTLGILKFWKDNYAQGKPIYVTENGFSTVMTEDPAYPRKGHHARGTEEEQAAYFANVMDGLADWNRPGGPLDNQVRAFCFWMYRDQKSKHKTDRQEHHFGVVRMDGSRKPAWRAVKDRLDRYESQERTAPHSISSSVDVSDRLRGAGPVVKTVFSSGTEFDFLRLEYPSLPKRQAYSLRVETVRPGELIVRVNGERWLATVDGAQDRHELDVGEGIAPGEANTIDVWFTGARFPFEQQVRRVALEMR
jgi:hypothetical protein